MYNSTRKYVLLLFHSARKLETVNTESASVTSLLITLYSDKFCFHVHLNPCTRIK